MPIDRRRLLYESQQGELVSVYRISKCGRSSPVLPCLMLLFSAAFSFLAMPGFAISAAVLAAVSIVQRRFHVVEEAVLLMPTLGIQIQTKFSSGRTWYKFIPVQKILASVINEAVTPTTCYFYLALILDKEPTLTIMFEHLRPPLEMLRPVWNALDLEIKKSKSLT